MTVLFAKTDSLGDQLLATGAVTALLERWPEVRVVWLVRQGYEAISDLLPGARVFHADRGAEPAAQAEELKSRLCAAPADLWARVTFVPITLNAYAAQPDDAAVQADTAWWLDFVQPLQVEAAVAGTVTLNWVDQALVFGCSAPRRIGHGLLVESQPVPDSVASLLEARHCALSFTDVVSLAASGHECDHLAKLIEPLTGAISGASICLPRQTEARRMRKNIIAIAPGAGDAKRIYPVDKIAAAMAALSAGPAKEAELVLLTGPQDRAVCAQLWRQLAATGLTAKELPISAGNLSDAREFLSEARLLICADSFWAHLASAIGTPAVALWGLGHWPRFVPRQGEITILHTVMLCQNCNWHCCFTERRCITDLPVAALVQAATERLAAGQTGLGVKLVSLEPQLTPGTIREALFLQLRRAEAVVHERNLLHARLADLEKNFAGTEADRLARGQLIEQQGQKISRIEGELDARLKELTNLYAEADVLRNERNLLQARLADLQRNFDALEQDYGARGLVIEEQGRRTTELERLVWLTEQNRDYWKDLHAKSTHP